MSFIFSTILISFWSQAGALRWARIMVSPPPLSPSHPPTPPPSWWPALTTLPPLVKFQIVWRRLCENLLSSSSLAGQKHPSLLPGLVWNVWNIKLFLPWTWILNRLLYLRTQWMRSQGRSQFEHDHRQRVDRAPQITGRFTWDRRRALWHI